MDNSEAASVASPSTTAEKSEKINLSSTDIANRGVMTDSCQNSGIPPPPYTRDDNEICRIEMLTSTADSQQQISRTPTAKTTCFFGGFLLSGAFLIATGFFLKMSDGTKITDHGALDKQLSNNYTTIGPIFLGLGFTIFVVGAILICRVCKSVYGSDGRDLIVAERQVISRRTRDELHGHDNEAYEFSVPHRHMDVPDLGLFVYPVPNRGNSPVPRVYQRPPGYWEDVPPPAYTETTIVPTHGTS